MSARELRVRPLTGIGEIGDGADLGAMVASTASPGADEVVVLSQKIVSKAEGRLRRLADVEVGDRASELAELTGKDPAMVELILAESRAVVRAVPGVLITETKGGWVCANAGIDASNLPEPGWVALLPEDADASARRIRAEIREAVRAAPAVVIADSFGRPWRLGQADVAIGCAGLEPLDDWRGRADRAGNELVATRISTADQAAAAADLVRDKDSGIPGAVITGLGHLVTAENGPGARAQQRPAVDDLFR
jgi:coenzyme F420-0:L-glutamate ligase/coenzyme F420-1:gamma-L-glutamate ligase